jgi:hypothetical protein
MAHHQAPAAPPDTTTIRQQLDNLLRRIETDQQALAAEQAAVARATEVLHETFALQAVIAQGQEIMRARVLALIDHQLGMIRESPTAVLLRALRRQVGEVEL